MMKQYMKLKIINSVDVLKKWFVKNNLQMNKEKTKIINFSCFNRDKDAITTIKKNVRIIASVKHALYLGVQLYSRMNWRPPISNNFVALLRNLPNKMFKTMVRIFLIEISNYFYQEFFEDLIDIILLFCVPLQSLFVYYCSLFYSCNWVNTCDINLTISPNNY